MGIINDMSIVSEKNGIKQILNPSTEYFSYGEVFYVNKAERTVTCVLYGCQHGAANLVAKYADRTLAGYYEDLSIQYSYVGIAKCAPEDEFDEEYGMRLARYRANRKREGDIKVVTHRFTKNMRLLADILDRKCENSANPPVNN